VVGRLPDGPVHRDRRRGGEGDGPRFGGRRGGRRGEADAQDGDEKAVEGEPPRVCEGGAHCVLLS